MESPGAASPSSRPTTYAPTGSLAGSHYAMFGQPTHSYRTAATSEKYIQTTTRLPAATARAGGTASPFGRTPIDADRRACGDARRRVASVTQPASSDLDQTCLYENDSATYPALLTDTGTYPRVSNCYQVNTGSTPNARLVPDSDGIFTSSELAQGQSTSFWHDSMTVENPGTPSLAETGTYSYRAVSFDLCGNGSPYTSAQATTILCGEDPASGEKPPAVTAASASCCSNPVSLTWTGVPSDTGSPSTPTNPYDLAGYRIFRSTSADFTGSTMISGAAPYWSSTYSDATVSDGGTYYYRIVSTDCPYERNNPSEATIKSDMLSGTTLPLGLLMG